MIGMWREPVDDTERRPLFNGVKTILMDHPGYTGRAHRDAPPAVRIGLRVACSPLASSSYPSTSELRRAFLRVLAQPPITGLIAALTHVEGLAWSPRDCHRRHNHGAVLTGDQHDTAPAGWARILLPEPDTQSFWRDPRCADFVLYVEPRTRRGDPAPAQDIAFWHRILSRALAIPDAIASALLSAELDLHVGDSPPAVVAAWLFTTDDLTQLVDLAGCTRLPGTRISSTFDAYTVADPDGQQPNAVATEWIRQMCDDALHLDGYEPTLLTLDPD